MPCHDGCWLVNEPTVRQVLPRRGSKEDRHLIPPSGLPAAVLIPTPLRREDTMFMIGIVKRPGFSGGWVLNRQRLLLGVDLTVVALLQLPGWHVADLAV